MAKVSMTFESDIARVVGVDAAIILQNMEYWIAKNQANRRHDYEGKYWTYNSARAFSELFDWLSAKQVRTCLTKLIAGGYIEQGNFNHSGYDRTYWYCL